MKVKIFRSGETASVEQEMNEWFDTHKTITITNIVQSESAFTSTSGFSYRILTISVFYKTSEN